MQTDVPTTAYYMGIDAGGTKTHCLISDREGNVAGFGRSGCGNYEGVGVDAARENIEAAIDDALERAALTLKDVARIGMGVAGADLPEDYPMLSREIFDPLLGDIPYILKNDSFAALRGGTKEPFGVVVSCGTGVVAAARNRDGEEDRVGGLGPFFGDHYSASQIGLLGLASIFRAADGVGPDTSLTETILDLSGTASVPELLSKLYHGELSTESFPPLAKLVHEAAATGDGVSQEILIDAGREMGRMANAAARKVGLTGDEFAGVTAGSGFKGGCPAMVDSMRGQVHTESPRARLQFPIYEPVVGALLLAIEAENSPASETTYTNLDATLPSHGKMYS